MADDQDVARDANLANRSDTPVQFVPAEDFKRLEAAFQSQSQVLESMQTSLQAIAASRASTEPPPTADAVAEIQRLDEALTHAEAEGETAKVRQLLDRKTDLKIRLAQEQTKREHIDPLQTTGFNAMASFARESVIPRMPHYARYKKEIDAYFDQLPPAAKIQPSAYEIAYQAVVGKHHDEIVKEETDKAIRGSRDAGGANPPGDGGSGRGAETENVPSVEELMGRDAADALAFMGRTPDEHARRLGYTDWADYAKLAQKQMETP